MHESASFMRWYPRPAFVSASALAGWAVLVVSALAYLWSTKFEPGAETLAARSWPRGTSLKAGPSGTLILFLHRGCPCSRASISEVRKALDGSDAVQVHVLVEGPSSEKLEGPDVEPFARAELPRANFRADDGTEARRFGVRTSGHLLLYDRRGGPRSSGGITVARGHGGEGPAFDRLRAALASLWRPALTPVIDGPVFGCALEEAQ